MRPNIVPVAATLGERLVTEIAPELTGFRAGNASMIGAMLKMISEEWDRAASRLVEENVAIRQILGRAAELFGDDAFAAEARGQDQDLRIGALEAVNDRLRAALIVLHMKVEQAEGEDMRALDDAIWRELAASVERRRISSANF